MKKLGNKVLRSALDKVFDTHPGMSVNLPALRAMMIQFLNIAPFEFEKTEKAVDTFIKKKGEDKYLLITKGREGGVRRIKDFPKDEVQAIKDRAAATVKGFAIKQRILDDLEKTIEIVRAKPAMEFVK